MKFTTLALLIATSCVDTMAASLDGSSDLQCRLLQMWRVLEGGDGSSESRYECETTPEQEPDHFADMTYQIDLSEEFLAENVIEQKIGNGEEVIISIPQGKAIRNDAAMDVIEYPVDANVTLVEKQNNKGGRRLQWYDGDTRDWTHGNKRMLVVRLQSLDANVTLSREKLSGLIFGRGKFAEPVNVGTQFESCSRGLLRMLPAEGDSITDGVGEIMIPYETVGKNPRIYENYIQRETSRKFAGGGRIQDQYDHVLYCYPKGAQMPGGFLGFAWSYTYRSFYNDDACGFLSIVMHEVGHNLGLGHAGRQGGNSDYGDVSGYMGHAHMTFGGPAMCFNGAKNWYLQWYHERRVELNGSRAWTGKLVPFTQYEETFEGEHVVMIKVGKYLLSYNKAETYNVGTKMFRNEISVTAIYNNQKSYNYGSMSRSDPVFAIDDFDETGYTLIIEACDFTEGDPEYFTMSIHLDNGYQNTFCGGRQQDHLLPTSWPTVSPSVSPSRYSPTDLPSFQPSVSAKPSTTPTRNICEDKPGVVYYGLGCNYIARFPDIVKTVCVPGTLAWDVCEDTCERCQDNCHDKPGRFYIDERWGHRTCLWLSLRPEYVQRFCRPDHMAYELCGELCNSCEDRFWPTPYPSLSPSQTTLSPSHSPSKYQTPAPTAAPTLAPIATPSVPPTSTPNNSAVPSTTLTLPPTEVDGCNDSAVDTFLVRTPRRSLGQRNCDWLSRKQVWQWILCKPGNRAYDVCPGLCGKCTRPPTLAPTTTQLSAPPTPTQPTTVDITVAPTTTTTEGCQDSLTQKFLVRTPRRMIGQRNCDWLSRKVVWQRILCKPGNDAYDVCPELCGKCSDNCHDDETFEFFVNDRLQHKNCRFLRRRQDLAKSLCQKIPSISSACKETCNSCTKEENNIVQENAIP